MKKKGEFTTVERAIQTIDGFEKVYKTLQQQTILRGQSQSTLENYIRQIALISLEFNKLPEDLSEDDINGYLTTLAMSPKSPSRSSFKHAIYGLRYYYRHIGQTQRAINLPSLKQEAKLPVILNREELRQLFKAPTLLKHRIALALIYSGGLRSQEASNMKISDIVFTVPEELNQICLLDSKLFYKTLFESVWNVLQQFGYTKYGVESCAICVLHIPLKRDRLWGQNLSLHPHIHCIVPSVGLTLAGNLKRITKNGKYLYPVLMLSPAFRSFLLKKLKFQLNQTNQLLKYQALLDDVWKKPWVVYCKPPFGNAQPRSLGVKYLGQYSHRVAISNHRIKNISGSGVTFFYKDYKDESTVKPTTLSGVEFLRRFCMHILPKRFVKIRYYGILSTKQKERIKSLIVKKPAIKIKESRQERIVRLTGFNYNLCPVCKKGFMHTIEMLPKIRAPVNVLYENKILSC